MIETKIMHTMHFFGIIHDFPVRQGRSKDVKPYETLKHHPDVGGSIGFWICGSIKPWPTLAGQLWDIFA